VSNLEKSLKFYNEIQGASPIDSHVLPEPWDMPGYDSKVIMASGAFTAGSSIELSCDGPLRAPYIAFLQGSLTYGYGIIAVIKAVKQLL
jgi:cystathionine beta-lyase family protein involved in aluminum resistance